MSTDVNLCLPVHLPLTVGDHLPHCVLMEWGSRARVDDSRGVICYCVYRDYLALDLLANAAKITGS